MAVTVKKAVLWRKEIDNRPGMLANIRDQDKTGAELRILADRTNRIVSEVLRGWPVRGVCLVVASPL
jgi:hypothetical protein